MVVARRRWYGELGRGLLVLGASWGRGASVPGVHGGWDRAERRVGMEAGGGGGNSMKAFLGVSCRGAGAHYSSVEEGRRVWVPSQ
jgi:hypothetical protein